MYIYDQDRSLNLFTVLGVSLPLVMVHVLLTAILVFKWMVFFIVVHFWLLYTSCKPSLKRWRNSTATTRRNWKISEGFWRSRCTSSSNARCIPWLLQRRHLVEQGKRRNKRLLTITVSRINCDGQIYCSNSSYCIFMLCDIVTSNTYNVQFLMSRYFICLFS